MHIQELATRLGARVDPEADLDITGVATIEDAGPNDITFLANERYATALRTSGAGAVLVAPDFDETVAPARLEIDNPYLAFAHAIELFWSPPAVAAGVHPTAIVGKDVTLGEGVSIGAYVVLGDHVTVGDGVVVHPHVVIYEGASIGRGSILHSHTVVRENVRLGEGVILQNGAVVGADGFGFAPRADRSWHKIPQAGTVELAADVEIQANACVDRATVGATTVGRGTKIDNLAQVGHGCHVGEDTLLCGLVGLAGSVDVGSRVILAGQVGVAGHTQIVDDVIVAAKAGVPNGIKEPGVYGGAPAQEARQSRKCFVQYAKLPEMAKRLKKVERRLEALDGAGA